jgi:hypothetical protein
VLWLQVGHCHNWRIPKDFSRGFYGKFKDIASRLSLTAEEAEAPFNTAVFRPTWAWWFLWHPNTTPKDSHSAALPGHLERDTPALKAV